MPSLILIKSPGAAVSGQAHPLNGGLSTYTLGRDDTCDIVVPNTAVSRKHAQINRTAGGHFYIEDLRSRNGTTVNNQPVAHSQRLNHDDRIKICDFLYRFHDETAVNSGRPPLPPGLARGDSSSVQPPPDSFDGNNSTIEHTLAARAAANLLDAQPAERLRALFDISIALSRVVAIDDLLGAIADASLAVFKQADRCFVILTEDGDHLAAKVTKTRRAAAPGDDHRFSRTIVRKCLDSQQAYLSEDASMDLALGPAQSVSEFSIRSVMCVPLITAEGPPIGAIQLDTQDRLKKFKKGDLELLAIVANLASVAVAKASLYTASLAQEKQQNEIELARQVQLGFLPLTPETADGCEYYSYYQAALTVGGDYYDFIPLPDGRMAVLLGDVAGKGVPASLLMAKLSAEARYCLRTESDLAKAVALLNEQLIRGGIGERYVTFAAAVFRPGGNRVTLVNAGHVKPILYRGADGRFIEAITHEDSGIPLGLMSDYAYISAEIAFEPGDNLLIFSDGVTDASAPNGEMFLIEGVQAALAGKSPPVRPKAIGERIIQAMTRHSAGRPQFDDIAFVCFGRLSPEALAGISTIPDIRATPVAGSMSA